MDPAGESCFFGRPSQPSFVTSPRFGLPSQAQVYFSLWFIYFIFFKKNSIFTGLFTLMLIEQWITHFFPGRLHLFHSVIAKRSHRFHFKSPVDLPSSSAVLAQLLRARNRSHHFGIVTPLSTEKLIASASRSLSSLFSYPPVRRLHISSQCQPYPVKMTRAKSERKI